MNNLRALRTCVAVLSFALLVSLGCLAYVLFQNYWWKRSVDIVADQAGASQAMSMFRSQHLVLWEINPTNDAIHFSGRHDGPFEIWLDEYHSHMPAPWQYSRRRIAEAHNTQMRYMYEHPQRFRTDVPSKQGATNDVPK